MSDLTKLKEIIQNQAERGIKTGVWRRLDYKEGKNYSGNRVLDIESVKVSFAFSKQGRLLGIYNWQY